MSAWDGLRRLYRASGIGHLGMSLKSYDSLSSTGIQLVYLYIYIQLMYIGKVLATVLMPFVKKFALGTSFPYLICSHSIISHYSQSPGSGYVISSRKVE